MVCEILTRDFDGAGCLHRHGRKESLDRRERFESHIAVFRRNAAVLLFRFEDGGSMFELLLVVYLTAWLHIPGDTSRCNHRIADKWSTF